MIKFPKVHIATSVVNRILNVAEGMPRQPPGRVDISAPPAPSGEALSVKSGLLDTDLLTPPSGPLPGIEAAPGVVTGAPLLDTLLTQ